MKNLTYLYAIIALSIGFNACDLNTDPTDRIVSSYFWKTESDALMGVNAIYRTIGDYDYFYFDCASDIAFNQTSWERAHLLGSGSQNAETMNWSVDKWKESYITIQRTNELLEKIEDVKDITLEKKNRIKAEARFLRAFTYTDMIALWGDVPFTTKLLNFKDGDLPRSSKNEIFEFIVKELGDIEQYLPEKYEGADVGRVTKGATKALLARVYLRENKYAEAKVAAKSVMDMNVYGLYDSYEKLFKYAGENCKEVIFDKQYIPTNYKNDASKLLSPLSSLGESRIVPLKKLVDAYEMEATGKPITDPTSGYDPLNPYEGRDSRLKATILTPGALMYNQQIFNPIPGSSASVDVVGSSNLNVSRTGFNFRKYVNPEDLAENNNNCHNNIILLRYADILLTYAEAKIETDDIDNSVYDAINDIRRRANMPEITTGKSKAQLVEIIRHERMVELALEGSRYFDIRRWKIAETVMPGVVQGITYMKDGNFITVNAETRKFNKNRDYLWPIPQRERNVNSNLTQNPNY